MRLKLKDKTIFWLNELNNVGHVLDSIVHDIPLSRWLYLEPRFLDLKGFSILTISPVISVFPYYFTETEFHFITI